MLSSSPSSGLTLGLPPLAAAFPSSSTPPSAITPSVRADPALTTSFPVYVAALPSPSPWAAPSSPYGFRLHSIPQTLRREARRPQPVASHYLASLIVPKPIEQRPSASPEQLALVRHSLATSVYTAATVAAYTAATTRFLAYCSATTHQARHPTIAALDHCMQDYICDLYHRYQGRNRQLAVNAVYGLYMELPSVKTQLLGSERLLHGWKRLHPASSHPPITWPLAVLVASTLAASGYRDCAIAVLVSFDGLLRVGEMCAIKVADISVPGDRRRGDSSSARATLFPSSTRLCIRLATTKTGSNQTAELYDDQVAQLLAALIKGRRRDELLFAFPSSQRADFFRTALRTTCEALRLGHLGFTPHSLRHGGATHAHSHGGQTIEQIMHRGRWKSNSSCRTYIQSGAVALLTQQVSEDVLRQAHTHLHGWFTQLWSDCSFPSHC
jgi:integrase